MNNKETPPCLYQILRRSNVEIDGVGKCETCKRDFLNRECLDYKPIHMIEYWVDEERITMDGTVGDYGLSCEDDEW